jgi:hypothetical protein
MTKLQRKPHGLCSEGGKIDKVALRLVAAARQVQTANIAPVYAVGGDGL